MTKKDLIYCYMDILGMRIKAYVERADVIRVKGTPYSSTAIVHFKYPPDFVPPELQKPIEVAPPVGAVIAETPEQQEETLKPYTPKGKAKKK